MKYKDFIGKVHNKAHLADFEDAVRATRATLEVFGRRLTEGERADLQAQLPEEIAVYLENLGEAERFGLDEFYTMVNLKDGQGVDPPDSVHRAQAVLAVLQEAVSGGELEDIKSQLPDEFNPLFEGGTIQE